MNVLKASVFVAYRLIRSVITSRKLAFKEVREWIDTQGRRSAYGRGFAGVSMLNGQISHGFVEIVRESHGGDLVEVAASIYWTTRQGQGSAVSKTWRCDGIDKELSDIFGKNNRVRLDI